MIVDDTELTPLDGGLFRVPGLRGGSHQTGVKPSGDPDLALIVAESPRTAAGVFTTCATAAAPVHLCRRLLSESDTVRGVIINSGNANALTGPKGAADAWSMAQAADERVGGPVLVLSTGVIGVPLPIDKVLTGIRDLALEDDSESAEAHVRRAMLTTDTREKGAAVRLDLGDRTVTVGGVAKGSGMIHPNMATMLAVLATDAPVDTQTLRRLLRRAVDRSFHEITVDGDTSTNDAVILLAEPPAGGVTPLDEAALRRLEVAVTEVARRLAEQIIEDGEGKTRVMEIRVQGADSTEDARRVAQSVATSSLVKTALAGGDPNWGRILAAAGNAGVAVDVASLTLHIAGLPVFRDGAPLDTVDATELGRRFRASRVHARIDLGRGEGSARMLTTDLTHRYVEINAEYTT